MSYPTPMDIAESEDKAINALDEALDWPYSREVWDQIDAERLELLAVNDALALEVERMTAHAKMFAIRLAALELAAWDVHEAVSDALDTPEDADPKRIRKAHDAMGELLPAQRPQQVSRCQCCGAHLSKVEFGRATCVAGCSYDLAEST